MCNRVCEYLTYHTKFFIRTSKSRPRLPLWPVDQWTRRTSKIGLPQKICPKPQNLWTPPNTIGFLPEYIKQNTIHDETSRWLGDGGDGNITVLEGCDCWIVRYYVLPTIIVSGRATSRRSGRYFFYGTTFSTFSLTLSDKISADKNFWRTKFSAPSQIFGSFVRRNFFIGFLFPHIIHKKNMF